MIFYFFFFIYSFLLLFLFFFFFFQAEDGIRDGTVTGVQTCALPISRAPVAGRSPVLERLLACVDRVILIAIITKSLLCGADAIVGIRADPAASERSEERREGKSVDLGGRRSIKKKRKKKT